MSRWVDIRLPPVGEKEACILASVLETVLEALWNAHGEAIAEWMATHGDLVPPEAWNEAEPSDGDDDSIPF